jgi:hypothetical protein
MMIEVLLTHNQNTTSIILFFVIIDFVKHVFRTTMILIHLIFYFFYINVHVPMHHRF